MSTELGIYIKKLRALKHKSLRQVEKDTGISNAHLTQIENGSITKPSLELLSKLSDYFLIELDYLKKLAGHAPNMVVKVDSKFTPLKYVNSTQIHDYSNAKEAEGVIPELVRDLIVSTVNHDFLEMPVGQSVFMHGWDGLVNCKNGGGSQFVPEGYSCWELSKSKVAVTKIISDFKKRTKNPLGQDIKNSTYVQVHSRRLSKKDKSKLETELSNSDWKDVKILDAEDLELWLEKSPAVALSFAKKIGIFPSSDGIISLHDYWGEWFASTDPGIDQDLLLEAGKRCDNVDTFLISGNVDHLKIKSNDIEMGIAFLYSKITNLENKTLAQSLVSRSIVVKNEDAFRLLATRGKNLILIPDFSGAPIGEAKVNGNKIVSIINNFDTNDLKAVGRIQTSTLADYLKSEGGYSAEKAYRLANSCYGNLAVFRLMISEEGQVSPPAWTTSEFGPNLIPLIMLGAWNSANENDRLLLEKIEKKDYSEIERYLDSIPQNNNVLFQKHNSAYSFYQEYSYAHLYRYINVKNLDAFLAVAKEVLCEPNTKYELEIEKRFASDIYQKGNKFSSKLRKGIATTLAIIANSDASAFPNLKSKIDRVVEDIFSDQVDWKYWASLSDILILLAEASPSMFLKKVEAICEKPDFCEILNQASSMGGCEYAPLLWALEACAWERRNFRQVTKIFLSLSKFENKKSNYVNQPSRSLHDIYRIWTNQSVVPFRERMLTLREFQDQYPDQILNLVLKLVPEAHEMGNYTFRPRFREIVEEDDNEEVTYIKAIGDIVDFQIELLTKYPEKWLDALDLVFRIRPISFQKKLLHNFLNLDKSLLDSEIAYQMWISLEKSLARHKEFPDTGWSVKSENFNILNEIYLSLSPVDPVKKWTHIFNNYLAHPDIVSPYKEKKAVENYNLKQEKLKNLQRKALIEILSMYDFTIIKTLIQNVPSSWYLGHIIAETHPQEFFNVVKLIDDDEKSLHFLQGLISRTFYKNDMAWVLDTLKNEVFLDPHNRLQFFLALPINTDTLKILNNEAAELKENFWARVGRFFIEEDMELALECVENLLTAGRSLDAFDIVANFKRKSKNEISSEVILKVLDAVMTFDFSETRGYKFDQTMFDYHLEEVLKDLSLRDDVDRKKLAIIEWNFLPLFKYRKSPNNLTAEVNKDPSLFIEILRMAYKSDDRTTEGEVNEAAANRAYQYLNDTRVIPGTDLEGKFNPEAFQEWFFKARELASNCNRVKIFDSVMGQILAHSPADLDDNAWPHKAVRDLFEKFQSSELERGLMTGVVNKRGVVTKSLGEGGLQERQLEKRYGDYAKLCEFSWVSISRALREIERHYSHDAHRADLSSFHE